MAAVWRSSASSSASLGGDPVVTKPTGTVDGDLLIAEAVVSTGGSITPVAGGAAWILHGSSLGASSPFWWKIALSEPASYTFTVPGGTAGSNVSISRFDGHHPVSPIDAVSGITNTLQTVIIPTLTSLGAGRLLYQAVMKLNAGNWTPPGTAAERFDAAGGVGLVAAGGDETVGAGATGSRSWACTIAGGNGVGYMAAIAPAPPEEGTFAGTYDFSGSGFTGAAGEGQGTFVGGYDFAGTSFVGVAGEPSAYGAFNGGFDFTGSGFVGSNSTPGEGGRWTPGGRDRFTARRTPKNRRRSR
jgi:hypothetical protein